MRSTATFNIAIRDRSVQQNDKKITRKKVLFWKHVLDKESITEGTDNLYMCVCVCVCFCFI